MDGDLGTPRVDGTDTDTGGHGRPEYVESVNPISAEVDLNMPEALA